MDEGAKSADIDTHTKTATIRRHHAGMTPDGRFAKADETLSMADEPGHQDLCDREQAFVLNAITQDLDLSKHNEDAVRSLEIVRQPDLFLFDEPLSNLDASLRINTRIEIANLHRTLGATMVYVTHDQIEAMTLADRIVVLNEGLIEQVGTPIELYNHPANLFVAGFIGSPKMNLMTGTEAENRGATTIGIRPEHIAVSRDQPATGDAWTSTIGHAEHLGSDTYLYVNVPAIGQITVRLAGKLSAAVEATAVGTAITPSGQWQIGNM